MTTLGIILIIIGIIGFVLGIKLGIILELRVHNDEPYILLCYLVLLIPLGAGLIMDDKNPKPTKQDAIDGKAIYQETQIITGNDTIKTYNIIWKQKN